MSKLYRETGGFISVGLRLSLREKLSILFSDALYVGIDFCDGTRVNVKKSDSCQGGHFRIVVRRGDD